MLLPEFVKQLAPGEQFQFDCHPGVRCFTECCRELELALTPYDVLRIKNALQMHSNDFLDQYVVIENEENEPFPRCYLAMVDDGRASCPFISKKGCHIYKHRPGACRTYPLGRAVSQSTCGNKQEFHVLLTEPHCHGFESSKVFTVEEWVKNQELTLFNKLNDEVMTLLQHDKVKKGIELNNAQKNIFLLALYNLDKFRDMILQNDLDASSLSQEELHSIRNDDTSLLRFGLRWLKNELFEEKHFADDNETCKDFPLGLKLTEKLRRVAEHFHDGEGGCHGPDHSRRVYQTALYIGGKMNADLNILSAAALLHDIGRPFEKEQKGKVCHAEKGAGLARNILLENGFSASMIDKIVHCIETHRYRGNKVPKSIEAKILFDADKLDSIGAIGIGRAFLFAGQVGAKLHNRDSDIIGSLSYSSEDTAYREFKVKLSKVKDCLLTHEGQRLAQERHNFMEFFFQRLEKEINGAINN